MKNEIKIKVRVKNDLTNWKAAKFDKRLDILEYILDCIQYTYLRKEDFKINDCGDPYILYIYEIEPQELGKTHIESKIITYEINRFLKTFNFYKTQTIKRGFFRSDELIYIEKTDIEVRNEVRDFIGWKLYINIIKKDEPVEDSFRKMLYEPSN